MSSEFEEDEFISLIEACSQGPRIELFSRELRSGLDCWGDQVEMHTE